MAEGEISTERVLEERRKKVLGFFTKNKNLVYIIALIAIVVFAAGVRTSNVADLKDVTTGNYTLGPDLDPFLFLRYAQYIEEHGSLMQNDTMRYVPLGYNTANELILLSYSMVWTHDIIKIFSPASTLEYAAIVYPVICFCLAILVFFLFVRKVFERKKNSNLIALISTAFFAVLPHLLHRTVAGIPEKEAPGILFMFLAFWLFTCALKAKNAKSSLIYGILAGIATGIMGLVWGGVTFVFISIALAVFILFFLGIFNKKNILSYYGWILAFTFMLSVFTGRYGGVSGLISSTTTAFVYLIAAILLIDILIFKTKIKEILKLERIKLPEKLISFVIAAILILLSILIFESSLISHMLGDISTNLLHPVGINRFTLTVAENNQPYFDTWAGSFGPLLFGKLPLYFWLFFIASTVLFYEAVKKLNQKWILTSAYVLFLLALIFSRLSSNSVLNGTSPLSQIVYFGGMLLFVLAFAWVYFSLFKKEKLSELGTVDKEYVFVLAVFFFAIISARGAIRLFFLLSPITAILVGFVSVGAGERLVQMFKEKREDTIKIIYAVLGAVIILSSIYSFVTFEKSTADEARYTAPSYYTVQWQRAMGWVRENTPEDSVFAHWWDYGYWVQSMGQRATVLDGGNMIVYWDHLMGRHVLTGQNETEALEFLKTHNANYLLIDPTDIGKYSAYSSIGSDENYDRYSWIMAFALNEKASKETRNSTVYVYEGATATDADLVWKDKIYPGGKAVIGGFLLPIETSETASALSQPTMILAYQGKQVQIPLRYAYLNKIYDFKNGIEGCLYIIPKIDNQGMNRIGTALFISEKSMKALWVKLYLLNQSENFELVHSEQDTIISGYRSQYNITIPDIIYYNQILGPIKIWKINYPESISTNPDYLSLVYLNPKLEVSSQEF